MAFHMSTKVATVCKCLATRWTEMFWLEVDVMSIGFVMFKLHLAGESLETLKTRHRILVLLSYMEVEETVSSKFLVTFSTLPPIPGPQPVFT